MILQKFVSTVTIINQISDECFDKDYDDFFYNMLDSKTFDEMDAIISSNENKTTEMLELLSEQENFEACYSIIKELSLEDKFILYQHLKIAALYSGYHIEKLPLFPIDKLPFNFFAYIETVFLEFQRHCLEQGILLGEEVFALSRDNFEIQNT